LASIQYDPQQSSSYVNSGNNIKFNINKLIPSL